MTDTERPLPWGADRSLPPDARNITTKVRQGITLGVMRWVLGISLTAVVIGMGVAWLLLLR